MLGASMRAEERYGAEVEQLQYIWEFRTYSAFSEAERAALEFEWVSFMAPNTVDDTIAENLRKYWDEGEIAESLGGW